jgi:tetratricopeptide (TPR) repeat protein
MAFVEQDAKDQIMWNRKAITILEGSSQPDAGRWAGSLHNNLGYALYMQGMYDEALLEFNLALTAHKKGGNPGAIRIAFWMIAWTLRALGRLSEALEIQLRLEKECDQAGEPDAYVFEELEQLYQALNDNEKAGFYANRRKSTQS